MDFELSKHAQEELKKRKIPLQVIQSILNHPGQIIQEDNITIYQDLFIGSNQKRYLLIILSTQLSNQQK